MIETQIPDLRGSRGGLKWEFMTKQYSEARTRSFFGSENFPRERPSSYPLYKWNLKPA